MRRLSERKSRLPFATALIETFGFSPVLATILALVLLTLAAAALVWIWLSAPPRSIAIASGPPDSSYDRNADAYAEKLKKDIEVKVIPTGGSRDNLELLLSSTAKVDVGF